VILAVIVGCAGEQCRCVNATKQIEFGRRKNSEMSVEVLKHMAFSHIRGEACLIARSRGAQGMYRRWATILLRCVSSEIIRACLRVLFGLGLPAVNAAATAFASR
jgi:hypothetical protein